jgi:hypothetical protein
LDAVVNGVMFGSALVLGGEFATTARVVGADTAAPLPASLFGSVERLRAVAEEIGWPRVGAWARKVAAQAHARLGDPTRAEAELASAEAEFAELDDPAGIASCRLVRADWQAAPFTGALLLDLTVQEGGTAGTGLTPIADAAEHTADPASVHAAEPLLADAERRYGRAGCPRGVGLVA